MTASSYHNSNLDKKYIHDCILGGTCPVCLDELRYAEGDMHYHQTGYTIVDGRVKADEEHWEDVDGEGETTDRVLRCAECGFIVRVNKNMRPVLHPNSWKRINRTRQSPVTPT